MWICKWCKEKFEFSSASKKANHSRWCLKNPERNSYFVSLAKTRKIAVKANRKRKYRSGFHKHDVSKYLVLKGEIKHGTHFLKERLFIEGLKDKKCETCGIEDWMSKELPFHLDHRNRDTSDNRIENLQILYPNCHYQKTREQRRESNRNPSRSTERTHVFET